MKSWQTIQLAGSATCWTPLVLSLPFRVLLGAWRAGQRRGKAPGWLATSAEADNDVTIDETTIARGARCSADPAGRTSETVRREQRGTGWANPPRLS
jgi:hypothetical protein